MDAHDTLASYFKQHSSLSSSDISTICSSFQTEFFTKEKPVIREGDRYRKIVYVAEGLLRVYVVNPEGDEIVKNFIEENHFFSSVESFDHNLPAGINVGAVTDCNLLTLTRSDSDALLEKIPLWGLLLKMGTVKAMNDLIHKQTFLRMGNSKEQYHHFVNQFPKLAKQVPLKYIASYLGITQSSLSRIRKQG